MKNQVYILFTYLSFFFFIPMVRSQDVKTEELVFGNTVAIVDCTTVLNEEENPIAFGKREFFKAIKEAGGTIETHQHWTQSHQNVNVILGTLDNTVIRRLVSDNVDIISFKPEGGFYQWRTTPKGLSLVVGGTDSKGLMYALLELAQQINDKGLVALNSIKNTIEYPENKVRGVDKYITDENDDSWFFSNEYWQYYLGQLAKNRFNRLTLITGYNDGENQDFMIPVYPYLLKVPGFEGMKLKKNFVKSPEDYLKQFRKIGEMCHHFGLEFVFGIWGHGRSDQLISGLPEDANQFTSYCSNGMLELLRKAPEIDGIQLRVNYESGIGGFGDTAENFWKEIISAIGKSYKERKGKLFLDIRAKGLTVKMREWVLETGINLTVTSKYSWEGVGLPYHPIEMRKGELSMLDNIDKRQRYGYADFLNHSRNYDFIYRLWGIGTIRMFTWANPDYAKRFSHTASFGGSSGFQVTPPLARKQNTWPLFQNKSLEYYQWEDQRYWSWYVLFGRLGYSKETNPEVWQREFKQHYGKSYEAVLEAYSAAGKVLPLITSSHLTYHPANYNWAEVESGGALFSENNANTFYASKGRTYQSTEPGDPGLFYSIEDYVNDFLKNELKPKFSPLHLVKLYEKYSKETVDALAKVNKKDIPTRYKKEYDTNEVDLKITATLAAYHAIKMKATTDFVFYNKTLQKEYLKSSLEKMLEAREKWNVMVELTGEIYHPNPMFLYNNGNWNDRLTEIDADIVKLQEMIGNQKKSISHFESFEFEDTFSYNEFEAIIPEKATSGEEFKIILKTVPLLKENANPKLHFRLADMTAGKFKEQEMIWNGKNYEATISLEYLNKDFDVLVYFSTINKEGKVILFPGPFHKKYLTPYFVIKTN